MESGSKWSVFKRPEWLVGKIEEDVRSTCGRASKVFQPQNARSQTDLTALVLEQQHMIVTDQILLRALMKELIKRCADGTAEPLEVVRELAQSLHGYIDSYTVGCGDSLALEHAKEHARMNVDRVCSLFEVGPN